MTEDKKFLTKIIYAVIIVVLLIPLYLLGRPAIQEKTDTGETKLNGGTLAMIRSKAGLAETEIGKIDPTSSTLQLATFGMRGIAIALLWHQSLDYEKKKDWNNVIASSNQIMILEPHFTPVWEFLGWRLAYNASADVDDYRERYRWVIRGFEFLTRGTEYNKKSPILFHKAGWTISQKVGIADENVEYRQLFREDDEFHEIYHTPSLAERDNWLFGIRWYEDAERRFEAGGSIGNMERLLFYSHSRMNLIHYAEWYEKDGKFGEKAREFWRTAGIAWRDFADKEVVSTIPDRNDPTIKRKSSLGLAVKNEKRKEEISKEIEGMLEKPLREMYIERWNNLSNLEKACLVDILTSSWAKEPEHVTLRAYLDETMPDWKEKLPSERDSIITDAEQKHAKSIPGVLRNEEEVELVSKVDRELGQAVSTASAKLRIPLDELIQNVKQESFGKARDLKQEFDKLEYDRSLSDLFRGILNYAHHANQITMEQKEEAIRAREHRYIGRKRWYEPNGIFDANDGYLASMVKWNELFERSKSEFDYVADPQFRREFLELAEKFMVIRNAPEFEGFYPENFPFEHVVRHECEEQHQAKQLAEALNFALAAYEEGKYDDAMRYAQKLSMMWSQMMMSMEYLKGVPVPEYRDETLKTAALYVRVSEKANQPYKTDYPLTSFINSVIKRDPLVIAAVEKSEEIFGSESTEGEEFQKRLDDTVLAWKPVFEKYPILTVTDELLYDSANGLNTNNLMSYRNVMKKLAILYKQISEKEGRTLPEDFTLSNFLP